jgi:hypothetical protein
MRVALLGGRNAHDLQRQRDVLLDSAPRQQRRRLEDVAVGARLARHFRRHAVDVIVPAVGCSRSAMTRRNVVLPQPDGPMKETNSPLPIVRSTLDSA